MPEDMCREPCRSDIVLDTTADTVHPAVAIRPSRHKEDRPLAERAAALIADIDSFLRRSHSIPEREEDVTVVLRDEPAAPQGKSGSEVGDLPWSSQGYGRTMV